MPLDCPVVEIQQFLSASTSNLRECHRSATTWANLWLFEFLKHFSMSVGEMFLVTLAPLVFLGLKSSLTDGPYGLSFTGGCVSQPYIAPSCCCLAKTWTFSKATCVCRRASPLDIVKKNVSEGRDSTHSLPAETVQLSFSQNSFQ